ncbi:MAG: type II CAAX endopeptidase family protein [Nitrospirota bacterium]
MELNKFDQLLLSDYPYIAVFYIPLKPLLVNLIVMTTLWLICEYIFRKTTIKQNKEIKLPAFVVFNVILASQLLPLIVNIIYTSIAIKIFDGFNIINIIKFGGHKINFFIMFFLASISIFIVSLYVIFKPTFRRYMGLGFSLHIGFKKTLFYTFAGLLIVFLTGFSYSFFFGGDKLIFEMHREMIKSAGTSIIAMVIISGLIFAPIGEEILFRGVIYTAIKERLGFVTALILQSALFSVMHGSNIAIPFLLGIVFALLYEKTKSLYPSISVHFFYNLAFYISIYQKT